MVIFIILFHINITYYILIKKKFTCNRQISIFNINISFFYNVCIIFLNIHDSLIFNVVSFIYAGAERVK